MTQIASVILPAHNESGYIDRCLQTIRDSDPLPDGWQGEVLVIANGCSDDTADVARAAGASTDWPVHVFELAEGGKLGALTFGDSQAKGQVLIYLDADVIVSPGVLTGLVKVLSGDAPRYASGAPRVAAADSWITRAYGRFWRRLPFVRQGVPGFGIFAMNRAGRARWDAWPGIISDDTFARLSFTPDERVGLDDTYEWPMVEGFANLVRVRRRQNAGVDEIREKFPDLLINEGAHGVSVGDLARLFLKDPVGFFVYAAVSVAVKTPLYQSSNRWARGR